MACNRVWRDPIRRCYRPSPRRKCPRRPGIAAASSVYNQKSTQLRAMMKLVIVGMLPLIAAFFLAQSGQPFLHWCAALLSVSLWLPIMRSSSNVCRLGINELQGMILSTGA